MKEMTKTEEAGKTTRVAAREKEGIAGSGIMNVINDIKTKSIGHGIEDEIILQCVLPLVLIVDSESTTRICNFATNGRSRIVSFRL